MQQARGISTSSRPSHSGTASADTSAQRGHRRHGRTAIAGSPQPRKLATRTQDGFTQPVMGPGHLPHHARIVANTTLFHSGSGRRRRRSARPVPSARRSGGSCGASRFRSSGFAEASTAASAPTRKRLHARFGVGHGRVTLPPTTHSRHARQCGRTTTSPASSAAPGMTQSPAPGSSARTAKSSRPPAASAPAPGRDRRTPPQRRDTPPNRRPGPPTPPPSACTLHRGAIPRRLNSRWQEPANGSDTLAMAQIRWHTDSRGFAVPHTSFRSVSVTDLARAVSSLLDSWFSQPRPHPCTT